VSRFQAGRAALALAAGVMAALAHPPFGIWPGFFGYALLIAVVDGDEGKGRLWRAFGAGWLAGFGYFLIGCWWVAEAFLVDAEHQAWMAPFAVCILPAGLGLFWGLGCLLYRAIAPKGVARVFVFAAIFSLFEWLRGHVLTGFPWNLPGETWEAGSAPSQAAAWLGAYGLTFVTVLAMAAFGPLLTAGNRKYRSGIAVVGAVIIATLWIAGTLRLAGAEPKNTRLVVRVVQPDVPQESKWTEGRFADIVRRYVNLTARSGDRDPDIIIWPEGALPASAEDTLDPNKWVEPAIARSLSPNQTLLMGTYREVKAAHGPSRYYNSLVAVRRDGAGLKLAGAPYDKYRLVPFGEYMPLDAWATALGVKTWAHVGDGFSSGPRPSPMAVPGLPRVQPLVCYESLFPGLAQDGTGRAGWIVNVSNDAWFGRSTGPLSHFLSGPLQHLNQASYRAIEQGLPLVRATPTGVSAMIDPWGRVVKGARLNPGESGVIDEVLPAPAPATLYSRIGDLIFWCLVVIGTGFAVPGLVLSRKNS